MVIAVIVGVVVISILAAIQWWIIANWRNNGFAAMIVMLEAAIVMLIGIGFALRLFDVVIDKASDWIDRGR